MPLDYIVSHIPYDSSDIHIPHQFYDQFSIGFLINCFYFKVEFGDLGPPRRIYHLFCLPLRVAVYIIHSHYFILFFLLSISCIYSLNNLLVNQKSNWLEASLSEVNFPNKNTFRHIAIMLCTIHYFIQCDDSIIHLLQGSSFVQVQKQRYEKFLLYYSFY